ncbi:MAG: hypothetical protein HC806_08230 [Anaerolineae bacterium]|nr:hypothetical protein [Anaerolineae bacterium]
MDQTLVENALHDLPLGNIRFFDSLGSTNDFAAEWAQSEPPHLSVVLADEQTAGRGRARRTWFTPRGQPLRSV